MATTKRTRKGIEFETRLPAAIAAVTECAVLAQGEATALQARLPALQMPSELRDAVRAWATALDKDAVRAVQVLQELRSSAKSGALNVADVVRVLTEIDARLMSALSRLVDLSALLEKTAESDERCESAYADIIEMTARLMQGFQPAQAATRALRDAVGPRLKLAADGSVVVLEVGAEGGSVTLIGRENDDGTLRFARITNDQTWALLGDEGAPVTAPNLPSLTWVDGWEAGVKLMDRYPWVRLYPLYVHPEFADRVWAAVEARVATLDARYAVGVRDKWQRMFERMKG